MYKVCAYLLLRLYGEVHLITDKRGAKFLKDIPFTTVDTSLDNLPKELSLMVPSLGKIYGYKLLADKGEPFFYLDADVIMTQKLPEDFVNADVFVEHKQNFAFYEYDVLELYNLVPNKYLFSKKLPLEAYNLSVFGGKDFEFIKFYTNFAMDFTLDKKNADLIKNNYWKNFLCPATTIEQYFLSICLTIKGKTPKVLVELPDDKGIKDNMKLLEERTSKIGYLHLWDKKYDPEAEALIKNLSFKIFKK